jgi:K+-sensing histidine kinase KdpD
VDRGQRRLGVRDVIQLGLNFATAALVFLTTIVLLSLMDSFISPAVFSVIAVGSLSYFFAEPAETVCCVVEDSGPGIDPTYLPHLFESFFTTKDTGMGMGLSIWRSIIEALDGHIEAGTAVCSFWSQIRQVLLGLW